MSGRHKQEGFKSQGWEETAEGGGNKAFRSQASRVAG